MKKVFATARAFTLIELLVVIAIIAILTGIVITSLTASKARSRDAERVSDLGQIQLALELYFDRCHQYPSTIQGAITGINNGCPTDPATSQPVNLGYYISAIPTPPAGANPDQSSTGYGYFPNANKTDYVLYAQLENTSSASANSLGSNAPADGQGNVCNPTTGYCVGPK